MKDYKKLREEVLSRLDMRTEYEALGLVFSGYKSSNGWMPCHNPFKPDANPSCGIFDGPGPGRGIFVAHNDIGEDGKPQKHLSFWFMAAQLDSNHMGDWKRAVEHYAQKVGLQAKVYDPPTEARVEAYRAHIPEAIVEYLHNERGLSDASIEKYKIGWSTKRERLSFPVYDEDGKLVNIRFHNSKLKPKTLNTAGYGQARLWGADRLQQASPGSTVLITEGELDGGLAEQTAGAGVIGVSPTNGAKAWLPEWVPLFLGHHVVLVWDCDKEGRKAVKELVLPAFKKAVLEGLVLSIKVVWLFENPDDKSHKDFTDWVIKAGGEGHRLWEMINGTNPYTYPVPSTALPEPTVLNSFKEINNKEHFGQRVTTPLYIYGENSETYAAAMEVKVTYCELMPGGKCTGRADWGWPCEEPIPILLGSRAMLASVAASDSQLKAALRDYICDKNKRPAIDIPPDKKLTLTEVYAHQVIEGADPSAANELVEKAVYVVGGELVPIGRYQATGYVQAHPKNQKPTMVVDHLTREEEDWQAFDTQKVRPLLREMQEVNVMDIVEDVSKNVTKIYERDDLHLGTLLTLCSPPWINFPGDGKIRGWINTIIIGDTGTGKTTVSERIFNHAGVGYRVSGMTSSRTGITYACEYSERKGWRVKAGALLKMSRQALIIDEAQDLPEEDLKTMAEAMDTGSIRIARIDTRTFEAMTRCLFSCNPKMVHRQANQRTIDSFRHGCLSLKDIFPAMMIRRTDLALFASSYDIEDKSKIYSPDLSHGPRWTSEHLRALVYYAWNLEIDQIVISEEVANFIKQCALDLSSMFGQCSDLPIVHPEDFRKTFCRLVVAYAILDLHSDDDFDSITVDVNHVMEMANFIDKIYTNENCQLDTYSNEYASTHGLIDPETLFNKLEEHISGSTQRARISFMVGEILKLDPSSGDKIGQRYFSDYLNVNRMTINRDLEFFIHNKLIESSRGYKPNTRLFKFCSWVDKHYPDYFKCEHIPESSDAE